MADTTAIKEQAKLYEERLDDLKRGHHEALNLHEVRYKEMEARARERETELKAQADGLLGTLGRINAETVDLRERLQRTREEFQKIGAETRAQAMEAQMEMKRLRDENERFMQEALLMREEAQAKIKDLQDDLSKARGKK